MDWGKPKLSGHRYWELPMPEFDDLDAVFCGLFDATGTAVMFLEAE